MITCKHIVIAISLIICVYIIYNYCVRKILRNMARDVIIEFNKNDIDYWVDFGTLLGITRDKDIIWGDNDVDICIVDNRETHHRMKFVKNSLLKKGYNFKKMDWSAYRVYSCGLFTDIYINEYDIKTHTYLGATGNNSNISASFIGTPANIYWEKTKVNVKVPENIHDTLVWRYGEDYNIPKPYFKGRD